MSPRGGSRGRPELRFAVTALTSKAQVEVRELVLVPGDATGLHPGADNNVWLLSKPERKCNRAHSDHSQAEQWVLVTKVTSANRADTWGQCVWCRQAHRCLNGATGGQLMSAAFHNNGARWAEHSLSCSGKNRRNIPERSFPRTHWKNTQAASINWAGGCGEQCKAPKCLEMHGIILQAKQRSYVSRKGAQSLALRWADSSPPNPGQLHPGQPRANSFLPLSSA